MYYGKSLLENKNTQKGLGFEEGVCHEYGDLRHEYGGPES